MSHEPSRVVWRKSSRSSDVGQCVELAGLDTATTVRDSKNPTGPTLVFPTTGFRAFLTAVKTGAYDLK